MIEIKDAYQTLGLREGASLRQVDEAYHDLRALWNPERLSDSPRLRAKASEKTKEIEAAFGTLIEHLSRTSKRKDPGSRSGDRTPGSATASEEERPSTSLLDEAFSERIGQGKRRIPVWAIVALLVFAGLFLSYVILSPSLESTDSTKAVQKDEESELARIVEEVRGSYTESDASHTLVADEIGTLDPIPKASTKPEVRTTRPASHTRPETPVAEQTQNSPPPRKETAGRTKAPEKPPSPTPEPKPKPVDDSSLDKPLLLRNEVLAEDSEPSEQPEDGPSAEQLEVFKTLLESSATASKLVTGEIETLNFVEWSVIQQTQSETWIDLVASWSTGQEVHFFWSVNVGTGEVRPLNQASRNLEATIKGS